MYRPVLLSLAAVVLLSPLLSGAESEVGPFFEPGFPFYQSPVDLGSKTDANFAVRGILCTGGRTAAAFDQELLRFAGFWQTTAKEPMLTLRTMSQVSYAEPHRKSGADHPTPSGPVLLATGMHPGVATSLESLFKDPRPEGPKGDFGRGPLPQTQWRFEGIQVGSTGAAELTYICENTAITETFLPENDSGNFQRSLSVAAHPKPLFFAIGRPKTGKWELGTEGTATCKEWGASAMDAGVEFLIHEDELVLKVNPATRTQQIVLNLALTEDFQKSHANTGVKKTSAPPPNGPVTQRWPERISTTAHPGAVVAPGLALDRIDLPESNPWKRRIRPADMAFISEDRAAVLTYDGDVWLVDGFKAGTAFLWKRFASGLNEPLAIATAKPVAVALEKKTRSGSTAVPAGTLQVSTKNGLVRLYDRDNNDEADWYENFSDLMRQSQSTRSFPLDMDIAPDGSTFVSQGGIPMGGAGNEFSGAITRFAPGGRSLELFATHAREPYVTVHPTLGIVTGTDQQGHFIPSSVSYLIRKGDNFGFGQPKPDKLTPPLVWIPHNEDNSSSSQVWLLGKGMGALDGKLLHLSYGSGRLFVISPDLDAKTPQGAVIPLPIETNLPLLQARMHPDGNSVLLCGFQIYDSRTGTNWGIGRLRLTDAPLTVPVEARSTSQGVTLRFAAPLDPASVTQDNLVLTRWNYKRSAQYGSARYMPDGKTGTEPVAFGQVLLAADKRSVFIHIPNLSPVMQLEVRYDFRLANGSEAKGPVYFTIHQPQAADLAKDGFPKFDPAASKLVTHEIKQETPTIELGKSLSQSMGCIACHSVDGNDEGKTGPTWKGLFGSDRKFTDGSVESANEFYLRDSILDPAKKVVAGYQPAMASYRGILSDWQIESLILYIRSLRAAK